jgi:hypothetical protein
MMQVAPAWRGRTMSWRGPGRSWRISVDRRSFTLAAPGDFRGNDGRAHPAPGMGSASGSCGATPSIAVSDSPPVNATDASGSRGSFSDKKVRGCKRHLLIDTGGPVWPAECRGQTLMRSCFCAICRRRSENAAPPGRGSLHRHARCNHQEAPGLDYEPLRQFRSGCPATRAATDAPSRVVAVLGRLVVLRRH